MDLAPLLAAFPADRAGSGDVVLGPETGPTPHADVTEVLKALGGVTLASGWYRVFPPSAVPVWTAAAVAVFPEFEGRATVFACDWLGRLFAADSSRTSRDGEALVLMLEPGAGEALEVPVTVAALHTSELLEQADALVAEPFYRAWRDATADNAPLLLTECVGYRVPLFLGGLDEVSNLERTDMDVYWSLVGQMRQQTQALADGTPISGVTGEKQRRGFLRRNR